LLLHASKVATLAMTSPLREAVRARCDSMTDILIFSANGDEIRDDDDDDAEGTLLLI